MPWARASALERHLNCFAASHLPQFDRGNWTPGYLIPAKDLKRWKPPKKSELYSDPERDMSAASWGTQMHAAKAGDPDAVEPFISIMSPYKAELWPDRLCEHEVSVAYNCETDETQLYRDPSEDKRTQWKMAFDTRWVVGTADTWGMAGGLPWVDDLKTGWARPEPLTPAMLFYLMTRMDVAKRDEAFKGRFGRISITHWPRKRKVEAATGEIDYGYPTRKGLWKKVAVSRLEKFRTQLREAYIKTIDRHGASAGPWCTYCPSQSVCREANE